MSILETYLKDTRNARILRPNGAYYKASRKKDAYLFSAQEFFLDQAEAKRSALAKDHEEDPELVRVKTLEA